MAAEEQKPGAGECNSDTGSKLLMITPQWFNRLKRDGWIKSVGKNRYRIIDVVQGYIKYLQDENRRAQKSASASRVQDARAAQIEMQTARELRELVKVDDVLTWQGEILSTLCRELSGVPAASTRDLELRTEIQKQVNGALERSRRAFEEAWQLLQSGKSIDMGSEDPDA
ncbi:MULTISPECIES: hypothetical protein [unclassified Bradyrhizobium]|uniref:hypothetical protein n=2 Tax=unclassified Bradyrhizobium TaxID=2631580 RepID=UPI0028EE747C|nr:MULTISPECIES: hypothetical protein [unclassified Bradyrhizobium]